MCGIDVQMVLVVAVCVEGAVVMILCREISTIWESLMKLNELHVGLVRHLMDNDVPASDAKEE